MPISRRGSLIIGSFNQCPWTW